jgi:hypothetical protein
MIDAFTSVLLHHTGEVELPAKEYKLYECNFTVLPVYL